MRKVVKILEKSTDKHHSNYIGIVTPERTYDIIAEDETEHRCDFFPSSLSLLLFLPYRPTHLFLSADRGCECSRRYTPLRTTSCIF